MEEVVDRLKQVPLLNSLSARQLKRLARYVSQGNPEAPKNDGSTH